MVYPDNRLLFSYPVMSNSSQPHGQQHNRPPYPSSTPKLMSITLVMPSNHLILCYPLHLLPLIFPSIRIFSNESGVHIKWPKYWNFGFSISPSNAPSELFPLRLTGWISLLSKGLSGVFSSTTVGRHQFFGALLSLWSSSHNHTWPMERP